MLGERTDERRGLGGRALVSECLQSPERSAERFREDGSSPPSEWLHCSGATPRMRSSRRISAAAATAEPSGANGGQLPSDASTPEEGTAEPPGPNARACSEGENAHAVQYRGERRPRLTAVTLSSAACLFPLPVGHSADVRAQAGRIARNSRKPS
jgi:hypothetical protein